MRVLEKIIFLCLDNFVSKNFLDFSFYINQNPWCPDGVDHSPEYCGGACVDIKLLIPIMEEMKKKKNI